MVTSYPVVFPSAGVVLAGRFYRNTGSPDIKQPVVVVTGSWLTVQEQMPAMYARRLAELGFTTFTFDFSGFGKSDGVPRQLEMPARKIEDIIAAVDFVSTMSFTEEVGHLAICASAQYAVAAIARGARIRSLASIAGWFHDAASVAGFYGGANGVARRLEAAGRAADQFTATGQVQIVPAYEAGNDEAAMFRELDYYANPKRGAIPEWTNHMATMSWLHWLSFDGLRAANELRIPSLFVHSDGCVFPDHIRRIYDRLEGAKRLVWLEGSQVDFYDQAHLVEPAVDAARAHFEETLRTTS
jgi:fermentation-respiration switch protein FrsA (DUF1100 family)